MDRSETLVVGDRVWVDDELRTGVECTVRGFNSLGEPIVESVESHPLRFRGCDRRVLDYPWDKVDRERPLPSLLQAAEAVDRLIEGLYLSGTAWGGLHSALEELRRAIRRETTDVPF